LDSTPIRVHVRADADRTNRNGCLLRHSVIGTTPQAFLVGIVLVAMVIRFLARSRMPGFWPMMSRGGMARVFIDMNTSMSGMMFMIVCPDIGDQEEHQTACYEKSARHSFRRYDLKRRIGEMRISRCRCDCLSAARPGEGISARHFLSRSSQAGIRTQSALLRRSLLPAAAGPRAPAQMLRPPAGSPTG